MQELAPLCDRRTVDEIKKNFPGPTALFSCGFLTSSSVRQGKPAPAVSEKVA